MADSTILGLDGRPMKRAELRGEVAGPTTTGVRTIFGDHPAAGVTPARMARLLREAEEGDPLAYLELAEDIEERDLHYLGVLGTRRRSVAQLEIQVDAAGDDAEALRDAGLVRDWLDRDTLEDEIFDVLDAIGKGFSATEIVWDTAGKLFWPAELKRRDPRWFGFDRVDGETLKLRGEGGQLVDLAPHKFVVHRVAAKSGLPIRGGLARAVCWWWMFKHYAARDWVVFCEVYGQPIRVGKYHAGATAEEKAVLLRAVGMIGTDAAAIMPDSMMIEFVKAEAARGTDVYQRLCDWIDQQVSKAVLGQTTTTDAISGGHAVAQEHRKVQEDIERADARQLASTLNRDLIRPLVAFNHGPRDRYPRLRIGRADQGPPLAELMPATKTFVELGGKVGMSTVRDRLGYPDPDSDEELLRPPAQLAMAPPGAGAAAERDAAAGETEEETAQQAARQARDEPELDAGDDSIDRLVGEDSIDRLVEEMTADWEPQLAPLVGPVLAAAAAADSFEAFKARLIDLVGDVDGGALADRLARSAFGGRVAGAGGLAVSEGEEV